MQASKSTVSFSHQKRSSCDVAELFDVRGNWIKIDGRGAHRPTTHNGLVAGTKPDGLTRIALTIAPIASPNRSKRARTTASAKRKWRQAACLRLFA